MEGVHDILSRAGIFQGVDPVAVTNLIEDLESVRYPRGATIFEEGEPGDRLYIITAVSYTHLTLPTNREV